MAIATMEARAGGFIVSEANGGRSRDTVTVTGGTGGNQAGTVLGKVTASGKYVPHDAALTNGAEVAAAVAIFAAEQGDQSAAVIVRDAEVALDHLIFKSGISGANKDAAIAALADAGIVAR